MFTLCSIIKTPVNKKGLKKRDFFAFFFA